MFKVRINILLDADELFELGEKEIGGLLPSGYLAKQTSFGNFDIYTAVSSEKIGLCQVDDSGCVLTVDEETDQGIKFWLDFGKKNPSQNPAKVRFAVVYEIDGEFRMISGPTALPGDALKNMEACLGMEVCYLVRFMIGYLDESQLKVLNMQRIMPDGKVGKDLGEQTLFLVHFPWDK